MKQNASVCKILAAISSIYRLADTPPPPNFFAIAQIVKRFTAINFSDRGKIFSIMKFENAIIEQKFKNKLKVQSSA